MEIQKMAWHPDSMLKSNVSQQRSDNFCGFENIQSAMCCSGILGSSGPNSQYGRLENGYVGHGAKMEANSTRSGGIVGNVGIGYNNRNQGFNGSFICDEIQKPHPALEYSHSLFSNWDHRNPLLESMTAKASQNNENSDVGQFSPGSGLNSRQNLDELVSKILEEDPSKSGRHDDHTNGLDERKFGLLPMSSLDFGTNFNNIWSSDEKLSVVNQSQQVQLNNASYSNADRLKSVLDNNWDAARAASGFLQSQSNATSGVQGMDHANLSQRKPVSSLLTVESHNQFPQAYNHKPDASTSRSYGSLAMQPGPTEMELAMRCVEKSVPLTSSRYKFSEAQNPFEAWCKSSVNHSQDSGGNRGFLMNSYPHGNHSLPCPPTTIGAHVSASPGHSELLLAEVKSTIQSLMESNPQGNAAKQYLAHCLAQSGVAGGDLFDSLNDDLRKQQNVVLNCGDNNGQNGMMPPLRACFERNLLDHNILYGGNKTTAAALMNGHNMSVHPAAKNPVWPPSKTIPGSLLQTVAVNHGADKREFDMADLPPQTSCGSHFIEQNQLFTYAQPMGRKHSYLTPNSVPCQNISVNLQSDMNQSAESILNHCQDGPIFHSEPLYTRQQQPNGFQFDTAGMPKVTQPAHISIRGIQAPWLNSQTHPTDNCDCNARCDVHNIGRVTPVILRPGEMFYNNIHPPAVFGLPQVMPDMKLQRCFNSSSGLLLCLEECFEQLRSLEKEEKEVETELMQHSMGRCLASVNPTAIPRLPHNPSRVNRLVVESLREHSKVTAILGKMKKIRNQPMHANIYSAMETWMEGIRKVQARRKEEIVSSANRSNSGGSRAQEEKDILALTAAVEELLIQTRRARTCLWCALQIALYSTISSDKGATETSNQDASVFYHSLSDWPPAEAEAFNGSHKCM